MFFISKKRIFKLNIICIRYNSQQVLCFMANRYSYISLKYVHIENMVWMPYNIMFTAIIKFIFMYYKNYNSILSNQQLSMINIQNT